MPVGPVSGVLLDIVRRTNPECCWALLRFRTQQGARSPATRARPAQSAGAPRSHPLLKASASQLRPIFLPPLILRHRCPIQPLHLGDGFHIPKRLHLVARSAHELIRLAWMDRVRRRVLSNQTCRRLAATHTALAALAHEQRVVFARSEIEAGHHAAPCGQSRWRALRLYRKVRTYQPNNERGGCETAPFPCRGQPRKAPPGAAMPRIAVRRLAGPVNAGLCFAARSPLTRSLCRCSIESP